MADDPYAEFRIAPQSDDPYAEFRKDAEPGTFVPTKNKPWMERAEDILSFYDKAFRAAANVASFGMANRMQAANETVPGAPMASRYSGEVPPEMLVPGGGVKSYSDALQGQTDIDEKNWREDPTAVVTGNILGGVSGGVGMAKAGLSTAGRFPGASLLARSGAAAGEGAVLGAAQGAGSTYTGNPMDYVENAGKGAAIGGVLGFPAPAVGAVVGAGAKKIMDKGYLGGIPGPIAQAAQSDVVGVRTLMRKGDRAMLPDSGPSMKGLAQGAVLPDERGAMTPGQAALERNLTSRDASSARTITDETNRIYGPARPPSHVEGEVRDRMRQIGPEYETLLNGPNVRAIDNSALARRLETLAINERGETQTVVNQVRAMLDIPTNPGHLDPHPRALQATREQVRGMMESDQYNATTRGQLQRIYRELSDELRTKVPGIHELDSRYAELGTQAEALTTASPGSRAFIKDRTGVTWPQEMEDTLQAASQPKGVNIGPSAEPVRMRQALRGELERIVGSNKNDLLALENTLGKPEDWNLQKLSTVFGRERASQMYDLLQNERTFRESFQDIVKGSQTAKRQASKEALDVDSGKIPLDMTLTGILGRGTQWAKDKIMQESGRATRDRIARIMSTNNPDELRDLIPRILDAEPSRARREEMIRNLVQSGWTGGGAGYVPSNVRRD